MATDSDDSKNPSNNFSSPVFSLVMLGLPFISIAFPQLMGLARSLPPNSSEQFAAVTVLFVSNRAYLYALSTTIVALASVRGATDSSQLGQRVTDLTEELFFRPSYDEEKLEEKPAAIQSIANSGLTGSLDEASAEAQALVLPLLISALFAASVFFLPFWNGPSTGISPDEGAIVAAVQDFLSQWLPKVSRVWNIGLLALFTRSEIRRLGFEINLLDSAATEWTLAVIVTALAFFTPLWQAQNFVNMALAILVSRAIQIDKFPAIVAALSLLTVYDAASVFLLPAANAADTVVSIIDAPSSASSAMGSVAVQKLVSNTFQPGLLVTKIGDRFAGALGLGDAVFPSLLAVFVRRFDLQKEDREKPSLFAISMGGYILGCFACEFAPLISTSGLPALVLIVPSMLGSVLLTSIATDELEELWKFDPKMESEEQKPE